MTPEVEQPSAGWWSIGVVVIALFAGLLTRLWFLQVAGGEKLAVAAQQPARPLVDVPALRGTISTPTARVLAQTVPVTSLIVDRQQLDARRAGDAVGAALGCFLGIAARRGRRTASTTSSTTRSSRCRWRWSVDRRSSASYVTEHRDAVPGDRGHRAPPSGATRTGSRPPTSLGYVGQINDDELAAQPGRGLRSRRHRSGRPASSRCSRSELRGTAGRRQGRGRQPGPGDRTSSTVKQPEAGPRRAAHPRPRRPAASPRSRSRRAWTVRAALVDPDNGNYYDRQRAARSSCSTPGPARWWRWRRTHLRPQRLHQRATPTSTSTTRTLAADQPRAQRRTRRGRRSRRSPRSRCCRAAVSRRRRAHVLRLPDGLLRRSATTRSGATRARPCYGIVDLPRRAHGVERRVLLQRRQRVLERLPQRGPGQRPRRRPRGDELPDAEHPVGNAIQHTARTYGFGEPTGIGCSGDQPGRHPEPRVHRGEREPHRRRSPVLAPR